MKTNKILATLLVFALVVTLVAPSFAFAAAPLDDVTDFDQVAAITKLNALGVLDGDGDGTFRPGDSLKREEFAKIAVAVSGNEALAERFAGTSSFVDVPADVWYSGWVEAAYALGITVGVGDGKFGVGQEITNAQAVTMLMRILGYKDDKLPGAWPNNFIVKANNIGLLVDGLGANDAPISRGIMAVLTSEATTKEVVFYDRDGQEQIEASSLLADKFKDVTTTLRLKNVDTADKKVVFTSTNKDFAEGFDPAGLNALRGHLVTVVLDEDDKVVAIANAQAKKDTVTGTVDKVTGNALEISGTDRNVSGASVYLNGKVENNLSNIKDADVTLFYDANADKANAAKFVVAEKFTSNKYLTKDASAANSAGDVTLTYNGGTLKVTKSTKVTLDGKVVSATELKENMVIEFAGDVTVNAYNKTVTGKVTKLVTAAGKQTVTIDGTAYKAAVSGALLETDKTYTIYLNKKGEFVHGVLEEGTESDFVGLVVGIEGYIASDDKGKLSEIVEATIVKENGELVVLPLDMSATSAAALKGDLNAVHVAGMLVGLGLVQEFDTKDNKIVTAAALAAYGRYDNVTNAGVNVSASITDGAVKVLKNLANNSKTIDVSGGTTTHAISSDVVVYDVSAAAQLKDLNAKGANGITLDKIKAADVKVVTLADIEKDAVVSLYKEGSVVTHIVMYNTGKASEDALKPVYGIFKSKYSVKEGDKTTNYLTLSVDGSDVDVKVKGSANVTTSRGAVVALTDNAEEGTYSATVTEFVYRGAKVDSDKDELLVGGTTNNKYIINDDTKYVVVKLEGLTAGAVTSDSALRSMTDNGFADAAAKNVSISTGVSVDVNSEDTLFVAVMELVTDKGASLTIDGYDGIAELVVIYQAK